MKLTKLFVLITLLVIVLSACGTAATTVAPTQAPAPEKQAEPTKAPEAAPTKAPEVAPTEAPKAEPANLKFTFWGSELDQQVYQQRIDLFTAKNPDIKVELVYIPSDYSQKVQTMIAGGTAPDIMQLAEDIHSNSSKGQIIPLDNYITQDSVDLKARYGETGGLTGAYSYDGKLYAMPDRGGALILYYNKDMFDAAGISYPTKD